MTVEKRTDNARQAERSRTSWRTLIASTLLGTIVLAAVLIWFFVYR